MVSEQSLNQHISHLKAMRVKLDIIDAKIKELTAKKDKMTRNALAYANEINRAAAGGKKYFKRETDFR